MDERYLSKPWVKIHDYEELEVGGGTNTFRVHLWWKHLLWMITHFLVGLFLMQEPGHKNQKWKQPRKLSVNTSFNLLKCMLPSAISPKRLKASWYKGLSGECGMHRNTKAFHPTLGHPEAPLHIPGTRDGKAYRIQKLAKKARSNYQRQPGEETQKT